MTIAVVTVAIAMVTVRRVVLSSVALLARKLFETLVKSRHGKRKGI
jgi:hypothetical protein